MTMRKAVLGLWALALGLGLMAQNVMPIGAWRTHLPKRWGSAVAQSSSHIYYATPSALLLLDKEELSTQFLDKASGFSQVDIRLLHYHTPSQTLMVAYENSVIDLYRNGEVRTINSIRNFNNILGEKTINHVIGYDEKLVFLAGSFGVSAFNIVEASFPFTTFMGSANARAVAVHEGWLYAGTEEGLYRVQLDNEVINDFERWEYLGAAAGLPEGYACRGLAVFNGELYLGVEEDIYRWEGGQASLFSDQAEGYVLRYLSAEGSHLLAGYRCEGNTCGTGQVLYFDAQGNGGQLSRGCVGQTNYAIEDQRGRIWFGDEWGMYRYVDNVADESCNVFDFNSPYNHDAWKVAVHEDTLWMATGSYTPNRSIVYRDSGMASFADDEWTVYNRWNNDAFKGRNPDPNVRGDDLFAIVDVVVNPTNNRVYAASYANGLLEKNGDTYRLYDAQNAPLSGTSGDEERIRISGLAVDEEGFVWVSNYSAVSGRALHRLAPDGTWRSFETGGQDDLFQIAIDNSGFKWVLVGNSAAGLVVFDEGDIDNPNDDRSRVFTANNSNLPTNETNCVAVDKDGDVWVGTNEGIVIFECGGAVFDDNCQGSLRILELDGFSEYLFRYQSVQSIAVDGANRKWVGTTNGAYLLSDDGREEILHFQEDDSPLLDNLVRSIAINDRTGEVFFATDKGLCSYQGDAVQGSRVHKANVEVFPNPVRPEYEGPITVRGLAQNALVKITDLNGQLVFETEALGGQALWYGRDYNGRKVQTGVYLVMATTNPAEIGLAEPSTVVAKVVFIN